VNRRAKESPSNLSHTDYGFTPEDCATLPDFSTSSNVYRFEEISITTSVRDKRRVGDSLDMKRSSLPLLVLDLDETLILGTETELLGQTKIAQAGQYNIYARPFLSEFIETVRSNYRLGVWSAASAGYANAVVRAIFGSSNELEFLWSEEKCTLRLNAETGERHFIKNLKKLRGKGFDLSQVLFVDDVYANLSRNYGNLVRVPPFLGDPNDRVLIVLGRYLRDLTLHDPEDFRRIEKRGWVNAYLTLP